MTFFETYWLEFITIASVHLLAVMSPGPDFAIVVKHSVKYGKQASYATSIGIGTGILLHVAYSLLGISLIIKTTPWLYNAFSYVAAGYLIWLAWGALRAKPPQQSGHSDSAKGYADEAHGTDSISWTKGFWIGFLTNGLNPKATLFFMSVFTVVIAVETPLLVQLLYGIYLAIATAAWFCLLSYLLTTSRVANFIGDKSYLLDRLMGGVLVVLAFNLIFFRPM